ncbi:Uncharacterized protein Fot_20802 [Forsythia ovata]|uniref:Uncharacterized protein n=1 Tax=Forsythia ovata TaxID=205694 RepID=A0ABD1UTC6_9LAMI
MKLHAFQFLLLENYMAPTFSLVNEVNATKKNWALRVLVVCTYETSSRDNSDEKSTLEFVFQDMKQGNEKGIPTDFEKLEEREMLFMVQVRDENVRKKTDVFSVTKLSVDPNIISKYAGMQLASQVQ